MRPQDIVILLKILTANKTDWQYRDIGADLSISISEISDSLHRSSLAGLVDGSRKNVHRQSLMEFIEHGLHYVFPQEPGSMVTGVPTAHSHPFYKNRFPGEMQYAWPGTEGTIRGLSILPLHSGVTKAVVTDEKLYLALASIDIIRVGRVRESKEALKQLQKIIL
jgi:hypothetical protein